MGNMNSGDIIEIAVRDFSKRMLSFFRFEIGNKKEASKVMRTLKQKHGFDCGGISELSDLDITY